MAIKSEYTNYQEISEEVFPLWDKIIPHIYPFESTEWGLVSNMENTIVNLPSVQLKYYFVERSGLYVANADFSLEIKQFFKKYCDIKEDALFRLIESNNFIKDPLLVLNGEIIDSRLFLRDLYDELINNHFIKCERIIFERHFNENDARFSPIEWHGNQNELFYLIWHLHQSKIIVVSSWVNAVVQHFVPLGQKEFTSKGSIAAGKSKFNSTDSRSEEVIKALKKRHFPK